jgi:hypothetical protein
VSGGARLLALKTPAVALAACLTLVAGAAPAAPAAAASRPTTAPPTTVDPAWEKAGIKAPAEAAAKVVPIPPEHTAVMMADYPAAARAAGVEGKAGIDCALMTHGAPDQCEVVSEQPRGQGFGAAALILARKRPQDPALPVLPQKKPIWHIDFTFKLKPTPAITPDVFGGLHVPPKWDKSAESDAILEAYPTTARGSRTDGFVVLFCTVLPNGHMTACIPKAIPHRFGFERAAVKLAPLFVLQTMTDDGFPTAATTITIPILFSLPPDVVPGS